MILTTTEEELIKTNPLVMGGGGWVHKLVFYRIPKNASTSITNHLGQLNLIKAYERDFHALADKKLYKDWFDPTHAKPDEAYRVFGRALEGYFSFCVCRNPWDRAVSMYHFAKQEGLQHLYGINHEIDFETFCAILKHRKDDPYFIGSHNQARWTGGLYPPKEILRFENLNAEFAGMIRKYGLHHLGVDLPHTNKTKRSAYRDYYDWESKKIIGEVFEEDVDKFGYLF